MNRGVEARQGNDGKKPQLSDLRESGAIEQDADMVCFIHRPEYYKFYNDEKTGKDLRGLAEIIIAKHRSGATDDVYLRFRNKYAKFQNEDEIVSDEEINDVPQAPIDRSYMSIPSGMNSMSPDGAMINMNSMGDDDRAQF